MQPILQPIVNQFCNWLCNQFCNQFCNQLSINFQLLSHKLQKSYYQQWPKFQIFEIFFLWNLSTTMAITHLLVDLNINSSALNYLQLKTFQMARVHKHVLKLVQILCKLPQKNRYTKKYFHLYLRKYLEFTICMRQSKKPISGCREVWGV